MREITKVGNIYTYNNETDMLKVANELEAEGFTVRRFRVALKFCVEITGYR